LFFNVADQPRSEFETETEVSYPVNIYTMKKVYYFFANSFEKANFYRPTPPVGARPVKNNLMVLKPRKIFRQTFMYFKFYCNEFYVGQHRISSESTLNDLDAIHNFLVTPLERLGKLDHSQIFAIYATHLTSEPWVSRQINPAAESQLTDL
jgi:hypothetical protein